MMLFNHPLDNHLPLFLIAGPCVLEPGSMALEIAAQLKELAEQHHMLFIFKASYDKANRSSAASYRGVGLQVGLRLLDDVKRRIGVPVLTDVHESTPIAEVASVVDVLQTPAFLVRQTDFMQRVAAAMKPIHVKKGQFIAPAEMRNVIEKCRSVGNDHVLLCERGACFGYGDLVADMRSLATLRELGCPVVFDATHSVQQPGSLGNATGGRREMIPVLARAAVAAGVAGLFMETHPDPDRAPSDGPNMWPLGMMKQLLDVLVEIDRVVKRSPYAELALRSETR
jgi:2-dehydro-3-deoxyphosphooctonate aldolase (KDO 8-P synthase)